MRVRDHVLLATAGAAVLYPRLRRGILVSWLASIFIDTDHYLWFCWRRRSLDPVAAIQEFNEAHPPHGADTRYFHGPAVLLLLPLVVRWRVAALMLLGVIFHLSLDIFHEVRLADARAAALRRDRFTCQACGVRGPEVETHLWSQPRLLPSYRVEYLVSLCETCHEAAHGGGISRFSPPTTAMSA
jgi:hypothetical protein